MRWQGGRRSANIEDRRGGGRFGMRMPGGFGGGLPGGIRIPTGGRGGGIGIGGLIVVPLLGGLCGGGVFEDDGSMPVPGSGSGYTSGPAPGGATADDQLRDFVSVVLADTEDTWNAIFQQMGSRYPEPSLVLFSGATQSGCGFAGAAVGPFYCGLDRKVYLDLSFFRDLSQRFGAPGDFARAYVIAHEVGHHVQNVLGIMEQVNGARSRASEADANALSVRLELQADCFAGLWANHAQRQRQVLEPGDIEEALGAAAAVGDDRLQSRGRGEVAPETFTHGSAEQRARWFKRGYDSGQLKACDTFGGRG